MSFVAIFLFILLIGTSMNSTSEIEKFTSKYMDSDSLKTIRNYSVSLSKDASIDISISDWDNFYSMHSPSYKFGENQRISTNDYNFSFDYLDLLQKDKLSIPEELNLYNPKSSANDLKSLMQFSFAKYNMWKGSYTEMSWWRFYVDEKENLSWWNDEDPNNYEMKKDNDGLRLDDKMIGIFHDLLKNKLAREIIYKSIKENYNLISDQISVFQKKLFLEEIRELIKFCNEYSINRKKYLNGHTTVKDKPNDYETVNYGYKTLNEGFLFRRIETDGVPSMELSKFLIDFQKTILSSFKSSIYNSNMSCEINYGKLKINSYNNSKNEIGFLFRTSSSNNQYFIPFHDIRLTKLEVKERDYWRISYNQGKEYVTLDENLKKI